MIDHGDLSEKPGWVRLSLHPTMTDEELEYILDAIKEVVGHANTLAKNYVYCSHTNTFHHRDERAASRVPTADWFKISHPRLEKIS